ncbi:MAG: hypothetical protein ACE5R6_15110 [Candidatus Heimdallarchaeota archaeon]
MCVALGHKGGRGREGGGGASVGSRRERGGAGRRGWRSVIGPFQRGASCASDSREPPRNRLAIIRVRGAKPGSESQFHKQDNV